MGGFLYFEKPEPHKELEASARYRASLAAMGGRGLACKAVIDRDGFRLHVYEKMRAVTENLLELDSGDFVVATGTCIYKSKAGLTALRLLYSDFINDELSFEKFLGHFAVWILYRDSLTLFNDYRGMYRVCVRNDRRVISSAFLPVYESLDDCSPSPQEVFEYLMFDSNHGNKTVVKEIDVLDSEVLHQFPLKQFPTQKRISLPSFDGRRTFREQTKDVHETLSGHFSVLADLYGDDQSLGLTGGYDSRMTLAYLRKSGVNPFLYVQGEAASADVRVAKSIAHEEGLEIRHDANEANPDFDVDEFTDRARSAYFYLDALPHTGIFDNWGMVSNQRRLKSRPELLRLYGMGGEYFRTTVQLADKPASIENYVTLDFDRADYSALGPSFDKKLFMSRFGTKIKTSIGLVNDTITRSQMELAFREFRLVRGAGPQMTLQNERAFALVPYTEPIYSLASAEVPIKMRFNGRFEAELIRLAHPKLASYPTEYGFALSDGPGLRKRMVEQLKRDLPRTIRPFVYRNLTRAKGDGPLPFFLNPEYLISIFPRGCPNIVPFIDINKVSNSRVLSRALSLELILSGQFRGSGSN